MKSSADELEILFFYSLIYLSHLRWANMRDCVELIYSSGKLYMSGGLRGV